MLLFQCALLLLMACGSTMFFLIVNCGKCKRRKKRPAKKALPTQTARSTVPVSKNQQQAQLTPPVTPASSPATTTSPTSAPVLPQQQQMQMGAVPSDALKTMIAMPMPGTANVQQPRMAAAGATTKPTTIKKGKQMAVQQKRQQPTGLRQPQQQRIGPAPRQQLPTAPMMMNAPVLYAWTPQGLVPVQVDPRAFLMPQQQQQQAAAATPVQQQQQVSPVLAQKSSPDVKTASIVAAGPAAAQTTIQPIKSRTGATGAFTSEGPQRSKQEAAKHSTQTAMVQPMAAAAASSGMRKSASPHVQSALGCEVPNTLDETTNNNKFDDSKRGGDDGGGGDDSKNSGGFKGDAGVQSAMQVEPQEDQGLYESIATHYD